VTALPSSIDRFRQWLQAPLDVQLVVEIAADYVAGLRLEEGQIQAWAVREVPAGAVRPAPLSDNIVDAEAVQNALAQVIEAVADRQSRCVLLVPDMVARIALMELEQVPSHPEETEGLLRWRLKKDVPFDLDQAVLTYQVQPGRTTAHEVLAVVALGNLIHQYEECAERGGLYPGQVSLSTLSTLQCLESTSNTPRLLVKRDQASLSLAIAHGDAIRLFRSLPLPVGAVETGEETLFEKIYPAAVYFHDQWGQPVGEIAFSGLEQLQPGLVGRLASEVDCPAVELRAANFHLPPSHLPGNEPDYRILPSIGWFRGETR